MKKYFFLLIFPGLMIINNPGATAQSDSKNMESIALNTANGTIRRISNFSSKFVDSRNIDVWLPDGYDMKNKYAVLYMHDGQMLFDSTTNWNHQEWGIDETLGKLSKEKKIRDCIVVGIWNTPKRHVEYFPQKALNYLSDSEKTDLLNITMGENIIRLMEGGPISDNYLKFIVTELKPFIDSTFSTFKDQPNTFISGSSMGGLISMYAICEYPEVFGGAACLSTHWPGTFTVENNPVPTAFLKYLQDHLPLPANHRIYFDYGSETLDALYKPFQLKADEIMKEKGYTSKNWITLEFPGENHSEKAWNKRFGIPALFLLEK
jgi:enterochelin esterase-like enzyme